MTDGLILILVGAVCACINVLAGGGSFLTLGVMMEFMGMPAQTANATNRVGILAGGLGGSLGFARHGLVKARELAWPVVWTSLGGVLGTWLALEVGEEDFRKLLAFFMVGISLWMLKSEPEEDEAPPQAPNAIVSLAYFAAGIYAGFVQAGVGFLLIAITTRAGLDLVRGTVLKTVTVLLLQTLSLAIFAASGVVDWVTGAWLAAGNVLGSWAGVHLAVLKGSLFIKRVVVVSLVAFAILLLF